MNYRINKGSAFIDYADNEMIALIIETGNYYTFSDAASALIADLDTGYSVEDIAAELARVSNGKSDDTAKEVNSFIEELLDANILIETEEATNVSEKMRTSSVEDDFELKMSMFSDVADYFMVDPIHEVDPEMGWPALKDSQE